MDKFDILKNLLIANRSVRRFDNSRKISNEEVSALVDLTRFCASGRNLQPLRYRIVTESEECDRLFPALAWAGYYKDWDGPEENERPAAYLVQCLDTGLAENCLCDDGLQLEAITLGATAKNISCCIIKAFNREKVISELNLPSNMNPRYVLALGYAAERIVLEDLKTDGDYRYYRDPESTHHVPKRTLDQLIIK